MEEMGRNISPVVLKSWMGGTDWIELAQDRDRVAGSCENSNETSGLNKMPRIPLLNTLRTGDANLRFFAFLHYNCERRMTQICVFLRFCITTVKDE
jgi:hypothetical protein